MDLRHWFLQWLDERGGAPLIQERGKEFSLNQLSRGVAWMAGKIESEDRSETGNIAILLPNTRAFIPAFYGSLFAGKTPVMLNPLLAPAELKDMIELVGARTLITISHLRDSAEGIDMEPALNIYYLDEMFSSLTWFDKLKIAITCGKGKLKSRARREISDIACMLFSSGTTGRPKAVMLTHENLMENNRAIVECWEFSESDGILGMLPFFHSYGLCILHLALCSGSRFVMMPRFKPSDTLQTIKRQNVTIVMLVPEMFRVMLKADEIHEVDWSKMRLCLTGGGPSSDQLREQWKETTGQTLFAGYGLTEHAPVVAIGIPGQYKEGSVGKPLPRVDVRTSDEEGNELDPGGEGELWVRSGAVMKGYYRNPDATAEMIDDEGWLHTGDLARVDEEGFLFLLGRKKEILIIAGENVLPDEIEHALASHSSVAEAAVVGVPDETRGERPFGFVVLHPGEQIEASDLRAHLRDKVAGYKIPKSIRFVDELPRTPIGKVKRQQLKRELDAQPEN